MLIYMLTLNQIPMYVDDFYLKLTSKYFYVDGTLLRYKSYFIQNWMIVTHLSLYG